MIIIKYLYNIISISQIRIKYIEVIFSLNLTYKLITHEISIYLTVKKLNMKIKAYLFHYIASRKMPPFCDLTYEIYFMYFLAPFPSQFAGDRRRSCGKLVIHKYYYFLGFRRKTRDT